MYSPILTRTSPHFPDEETEAQAEPVGLKFRAAWLQRPSIDSKRR